MDLFRDLAELARKALAQTGYSTPANDEEAVERWLNLQRRLIPEVPWAIKESRELRARKPSLAKKLQDGLAVLSEKARRGQALTEHMSRKIQKDPDFADALLASWNIQHFHLGSTVQSDGYVERDDSLLFAIFDPDEQVMYQIDVLSHGDFSRKELLTIVEKNWPHLLDRHELKGIHVTGNYTNEEIAAFRKAGVNVLVQTPGGRAVATPGGGLTTARTSVNVARTLNWMKTVLGRVEGDLRARRPQLETRFGRPWEELDLRLVWCGQRLQVVETKAKTLVHDEPL